MHTTNSHIFIKTPTHKVWKALTEPSLVKRWQYGADLITDWTIGSSITFHGEYNGVVYEQWGSVLDFTPHEYIKYNLFAPRPDLEDKPENYFTMTYTLEDESGGTKLTITQEEPRQSETENIEDDENGVAILEGLKNLIEITTD